MKMQMTDKDEDTNPKKLTLRRETLRQLTPSELRQVAGGTTGGGSKGMSPTQ